MSEMKYKGPTYLDELDVADMYKNNPGSIGMAAQALLAAEAKCDELRKQLADSDKNLQDYFDRNEREKQKLRATLEEYRPRYDKLNYVEKEKHEKP